MNSESLAKLSLVNDAIINRIQDSLMVKSRPTSTIISLFTNVSKDVSLTREDTLFDLAAKGDRDAKDALINLIIRLLSTEVPVKMSEIDNILEGYYINYYGKASDISSEKEPLLVTFLERILISFDSDFDTKIEKLAQVIYQECWGYGVLDEFRYLGVDPENYSKIEEIQVNGPRQLGLKIGGTNFKLEKLYYPDYEIAKVTKKLSRNSTKGLTKSHPIVETDLVDGSRVNLTCPNYSAYYTFNLRLHYSNSITREEMIRIGSSSKEYEDFLDILMNFRPRVMFMGGQGVGKTTDIVNLCKRYPVSTTVVTVESSFELELDKIRHLLVQKLRLGEIPDEDLLKSIFRYNAQVMIMGEARGPSDVMLTTQVAKRQDYGTINTWHSGDCAEGMRDFANALVRGGYFKTGREALVECCSAIDIVVVKRIAGKNTKFTGRRHIYQVCEIPKLKLDSNKDLEVNVLFEYDYSTGTLVKKNNISEELLEIFGKRFYDPGLLEVLRSGNYSLN